MPGVPGSPGGPGGPGGPTIDGPGSPLSPIIDSPGSPLSPFKLGRFYGRGKKFIQISCNEKVFLQTVFEE